MYTYCEWCAEDTTVPTIMTKKKRNKGIMEKQSHGIISPKMDYDEWTPIGRGDPLKNDPTFDYSPPMVGKVKYWINPLHRTPDPPILPPAINSRESTSASASTSTESVGPYTATVTTNLNKSSGGGGGATVKQSAPSATNEIKRFYQDYKETASSADSAPSTSYFHTSNPKFGNKATFHRPLPPPPPPPQQQQQQQQQQQMSYQSHLYYSSPTRQPPPPLPMLVPPPPIEPDSYSSSRIENSTTLELSWDNAKSHSTAAAAESTTVSGGPPRPWLSSTLSTTGGGGGGGGGASSVVTKMTAAANEPDTNSADKSSSSILHSLLGVEKSVSVVTNAPTSVLPLTPYPSVFTSSSKQNVVTGSSGNKSPTHLIIQGHSKVKKYGGFGTKLRQEKSSGGGGGGGLADIDGDDAIKYELPKEARAGRGLGLEDFLPINGALKETLKDIATNQAEGSGIGAELTKVLFPSYVRPSTTLVYESPRFHPKFRHRR